jgi:ubiquinone/menaquinone biosynthesis C-methylase UbiE
MDKKDSIINYYTELFDEGERLKLDLGPLEFERSKILLARMLPAPPARVIDVGGATGAYSVWLFDAGYEVHLVDPVPRHVTEAEKALSEADRNIEYSARVGVGQELDFENNFADAVLLMGPLYHLQEKIERERAIAEAIRVLKKDGIILATIVSKFASLIDGFHSGFLHDPAFVKIIKEDLESGRHYNPTDNPYYWTDSYFQHPDEFSNELSEAGFQDVKLFAIEGPAWALKDFETSWRDEILRKKVLAFVETVECEKTLLGVSPHILGVGSKP